MTRTTTEIK